MKKLCLIRAINVGGKNKVEMKALKAFFEQLGYDHVETYLNTGNVLFDTLSPNVEVQIEKGLSQTFGLDLKVFVYDLTKLKAIEAAYPFEALSKHHYITFFAQPIVVQEGLDEKALAGDAIQVYDSVVFLNVPGGYGKTKLTNQYFERKLGKACTTRNLNTLRKLIEKMERSS